MRTLLLLLLALVAIGLITPNPIMARVLVATFEVEGPILDQADAREKCLAALNKVSVLHSGSQATWEGEWANRGEGEKSRCYYIMDPKHLDY